METRIEAPDEQAERQRNQVQRPEDPAVAPAGDDIRVEFGSAEAKAELKSVLTKVIYNDMSAVDSKEWWVGTIGLAQETLARADLAGIEADPEMRIMMQALTDIAAVHRTKQPHVIAEEALVEVGGMHTSATDVEAREWNVSPDDRFPALDTYEAAVQLKETEGIARIEDFSESKTLNWEETDLLTVYHGTDPDAKFSVFDPSKLGSKHGAPSAYLGFVFTGSRDVAEIYGERIISAQLNLKNPYFMTWEEIEPFETVTKDDPRLPELIEEAKHTRDRLEREGYDGIEVEDIEYWVAFRPDQIRLERSETVQERKDRMKASLYERLDDIRGTRDEAHHNLKPVLSIAVARARETIAEHEDDLHFSTQPMDVQVMELAMRMIGGSNQTPTYRAYSWVSANVVDKGVNAFKAGVEFLIKLDEQGVKVGSKDIKTLAEIIRQEEGSSHTQLGEMVAAIAGAAVDEVNSIRHSMGQMVSPEPQKTNEVGQGNLGRGIGL